MHISRSAQKFAAAFAAVVLCISSISAETVLTTQNAVEVSVTNVQVAGARLQGEIHNQTDATLIGAELLVRHRWLWADELHPGTDDPGWVEIHPVNVTIPAGGTAPFSLQLSRVAPQRSDGTFQIEVSAHRFATIPSP
jgi:hypothetical protein